MSPIPSKQPRPLSIFFLTEMWERYGFYVVQTLLTLYLIHVFHMSDDRSYAILGSVTALAYINSIIGGYVADRLIGHRLAVLLGAIFLSIGYGLIATSSKLSFAFWGLAIVTIGTGLFKPNVSSMVGSLYQENDPRRHSGFTLFYVGINAGIILATTFSGYLQQYLGWSIAFLSATVVLLIAFLTFLCGTHYFKITVLYPMERTFAKWLKAIAIIFASVLLSDSIINHQHAAIFAFAAIAVLSAVIVLWQAYLEKGVSRNRILAYLILVGISTIYWAMYFQLFFSMNLFVDRVVDRHVWGSVLPPSVFVSIESFGVIAFGPVISLIWIKLGKTKWSWSTPMKFAMGLAMNCVAFGLLFLSSVFPSSSGMVDPSWLIAVYLLIAVGELLLSPIGLAMVTELVPLRLVGMMMGIFFISLGLGGKLAGVFADISAIPSQIVSVAQMNQIYRHAFMEYFAISLIAMLIAFFLIPPVKRLIGEE